MKKVTLMLFTLLMVSAFYSQINAQILLDENFDYKVDTLLNQVGYLSHSGSGNFLKVMTGNLTYTNYPLIDKGGMVTLIGQPPSSEDVNHPFEKQSTGAIYTSFLVKVNTASKDTGDYFVHYKWNGGSSIFRGRVYVKADGAGAFTFGVSKSGTSPVYTTTKYQFGTTYLIVVKYEYVGTATGNDDKVSLYINPDFTLAEPTTPDLVSTETGNTDSFIDAIALRQGSATYNVNVDGIRVAKGWDLLKSGQVVPVTFQVNMRVQILEGKFNTASGKVVVRGSFQSDAGDTGDWQGSKFLLADPDKDSIYTTTVDLPYAKNGTGYEAKYVMDDNWEGVDNKKFTLYTPGQILPVAYYNNDTVVTLSPYLNKQFTITFTADIHTIYNKGFNPNVDSLLIQGLDWDGLGKEVIGSRKLTETLTTGVFETTLKVTALADSVTFKYRGFPENHFADNGWEKIGSNRAIYFKDFPTGKDSMALSVVSPVIIPSMPAITKDMNVLFQVNMTNAKNVYDGSDVPLADIQFVGVKGADSVMGAWQGSWVVADTTSKYMLVLNDAGKNGDKVAGDHIWSLLVTFKKGTAGGDKQFKYGVWYTGASDHTKGAAAVLDNEAGFGQNHSFTLADNASGSMELLANFGNVTTDVKQVKANQVPTEYSLNQNYPNPFNPSTTIRYSVPKEGMVTLKIFNMLGQEVATLVHAQQPAGNFEVSFDASRLSSGIYLYNLTSGSFSSTKKMMLVK